MSEKYIKRIKKGKGKKKKESIKNVNKLIDDLFKDTFFPFNPNLNDELKEQKRDDEVNQLKYQSKNEKRIKEQNLKLKQGSNYK